MNRIESARRSGVRFFYVLPLPCCVCVCVLAAGTDTPPTCNRAQLSCGAFCIGAFCLGGFFASGALCFGEILS